MTDASAPKQPESGAAELPPSGEAPRRNFLVGFAAVVVGAVSGLFGLLSGLIVMFDPLTRNKQAPLSYRDAAGGREGLLKVATLDMIPADGLPRRFPVIADQIDAWNFTPDQPIGSLYIRRTENQVQVLHATCPHAGCAVSFKNEAGEDGGVFVCPCHNSAFSSNGARIDLPGKENPSPRDMDALEYEVADGEVWVKFEDFYTGIHEQKAKL